MSKKITIIGATGLIGTNVTKALVQKGYEVTALVRDIEQAKKTLPTGINYVKGELQNISSIRDAVKDAYGVYINLNTTFNDKEDQFNAEREGLDNLINVLKSTDIKQVAYLTSFLARDYKGSWWVMKMKKDAIAKIKDSGLPYTIFVAGSFMQNFETSMRQGKNLNTIGKPTPAISYWIAAEDFANMVANAFDLPAAIRQEYHAQGPQGLTLTKALELYAHNYKKEKLKIANLPLGFGKFLALFVKPLKFAIPLIDTINNTSEKLEAEKTWQALGKPQYDVIKFARR